ncbi:MAG: HEAT repeat domain-containing protein [Deltaproteobacteria bacterium]|nr:HEAT repeat domain-containing protein [Deltaproteobacteria bacterium]
MEALAALALFACLCMSCGDHGSDAKPTKTESSRGSSRVKLGAVRWIERGRDTQALSENTFRSMAERAFSSLASKSKKPLEIALTGEMEVVEGNGALVLETRFHLAELSAPFKTGIAATGGIEKKDEARALVEKGLIDLTHALKALLELPAADSVRLRKALASPEPDEQILALKLLGRRRAREALPAIAKLLADPRDQVAEAAADTLAGIGDEKAVPLLINAIQRSSLRSEVRAIEAMGRIGGKEAEAYLEMTAVGHEVSEVRSLSSVLLKRIRARK